MIVFDCCLLEGFGVLFVVWAEVSGCLFVLVFDFGLFGWLPILLFVGLFCLS